MRLFPTVSYVRDAGVTNEKGAFVFAYGTSAVQQVVLCVFIMGNKLLEICVMVVNIPSLGTKVLVGFRGN